MEFVVKRIRTSLVVVDDACADDLAARREDLFQFELRQRAWKTADVEVRVLNTLAAWTRVRHLHSQHTTASLRTFVRQLVVAQ